MQIMITSGTRNLMLSAGMMVLMAAGGFRAHAASLAQLCRIGQNKAAGSYAGCRATAESKFALTSDAAARSSAQTQCATKFSADWQRVEASAASHGASCLSLESSGEMKVRIDTHTDEISTTLAGGALPPSCPSGHGALVRTGQSNCADEDGNPIACAGSGQDGEYMAGLAPAFTDNGDGTITDGNTGLMWEELSDDDSIHDKDAIYSWGNAVRTKIAALNQARFAGYDDWRLPNTFELESLVDLGAYRPATYPAFNTGCISSCTVMSCSCQPSYVRSWTSTNFGYVAQQIEFEYGGVIVEDKNFAESVRAVRGGLIR